MLLGGKYLTSKVLKDGDVIEIISEGEWGESSKFMNQDGTPKKELVFEVKFNGDDYSFRMNATNRNTLVLAFGRDTKKWIGKKAGVTFQKALIAGKMQDVIILSPQVESW